MKVFTAGAPSDDRRSRADLDCEYHLPWLKCHTCEAVDPILSPWRNSTIWYPAFSLAARADVREFTEEHIVTLSELDALRKMIVGKGVKSAKLLPGSGIGPVRGKLPKRGTDFLWSCFSLLVSRRALDLLGKAGISIPYGPVIPSSAEAHGEYVALQLDPVAVYSAGTLEEMTLVFCPACGRCRMCDVRAQPNGPRQYVRSRIPEQAGLIRALEGFETIATARLMEVVNAENLTGIEFEEFGVYV